MSVGASDNVDRDHELMRYWAAGMSELKLAKKFNLSPARVHVIVTRENKKAFNRRIHEMDAVRGGELEKLALAEQKVMIGVRAGNLKAVATLLDIQKRRARLLGLDAPKQVNLTGAGGRPLLDVEAQQKFLLDQAADDGDGADGKADEA